MGVLPSSIVSYSSSLSVLALFLASHIALGLLFVALSIFAILSSVFSVSYFVVGLPSWVSRGLNLKEVFQSGSALLCPSAT